LLSVIFLYVGSHALYYGPLPAALAPLASGAALALLAVSFLGLRAVAHGLLRTLRRRLLLWLIRWDERDGAGDILNAQGPQDLAPQQPTTRSERLVANAPTRLVRGNATDSMLRSTRDALSNHGPFAVRIRLIES
jgi:hypothetical protein